MSNQPEKMPLSEGPEVRPGTVQFVAASPQQAEAVYIHNAAHLKRDEYKGKLSVIFGVLIIVLQTLAIVLNISGALIQGKRDIPPAIVIPGNFPFYLFSSVWCGIFVYISAGFAIAAGKVKSRGLIIAHLVLAVIACLFACVSALLSCLAIVYESDQTIKSAADKASVSIAVFWLLASWTIVILIIWCAVLCCKVLCCGRDLVVTEEEIVTPIQGGTTVLMTSEAEANYTAPPPYEK